MMPIKTPKDAAHDYFVLKQHASPEAVKQYAEGVNSDPDFVKAVIKAYFSLSVGAAKLATDCKRNWPEDKGY